MRILDLSVHILKHILRTREPPLEYFLQVQDRQILTSGIQPNIKIILVLKQDKFLVETNPLYQNQESNRDIVGPWNLGWGMGVDELENPVNT